MALICAAAFLLCRASAGAALAGGLALPSEEAGPALGRDLDSAVQGTLRPAYRLVEGISDEVFDFLRTNLICGVLPGGLTRGLRPAPDEGSGAIFERNLRKVEERFLLDIRDAYPASGGPAARPDAARHAAWRSRAIEEQARVPLEALEDTLLERYGLEPFGRFSENYSRDRRNWTADFAAMAGLAGASLAYLNGLKATARSGRLRLSIGLPPVLRIQKALRNGSTLERAASVEAGIDGLPVSLSARWGLADGSPRSEALELKYRLIF
jgi:hypothetical protein